MNNQEILKDCLKAIEDDTFQTVLNLYGSCKVYYVMGRAGYKPGAMLAEKRNLQIVEAFKTGETPVDIAKKFNLERGYIYEILSKYDIKKFSNTTEILKRNKKIRDLYAKKELTQEAVAEKFGISRGCVGMIVKNKGHYAQI